MNVPRETQIKLVRYVELLRKWSPKINLVAKSTIENIWDRHIVDSQALVPLATDARTWCDLGSGGGLPGIIVAIFRPSVQMTLIEADLRKTIFLRTVVRELDLRVDVLNGRVEVLPGRRCDVVSARALAPLDELIPLALRHAVPTSQFIFPKGQRYHEEIELAQRNWRFDIDVRPGATQKESRILILRNIERV